MFLGARFGDVVWLSGGYFGCRNALEFCIDEFVGKDVTGGAVGRTGAICREGVNRGVCLSFVSAGVSEGDGRHTCNRIDMCGGQRKDGRTLLWLYLPYSYLHRPLAAMLLKRTPLLSGCTRVLRD